MRRREFIAGLAGAATLPIPARSQKVAMPVIGVLHALSEDNSVSLMAAVRKGLSELGYVEGKNVAIEYRWADYAYDRLAGFAADLVRRRVAVIVALGGERSAQAAKAATSEIPIVFAAPPNPVNSGLVASLNRPSGNITGVTGFTDELPAKRLEQLHEMVPKALEIAVLIDPATPASSNPDMISAQDAATVLGLRLQVYSAIEEHDIETAFSNLVKFHAGALLVGTSVSFLNWRDKIIALAARHKIPASYYRREFVYAGGLIAYSADLDALYHQAGVYTGRVLNGERPADLPVIQPTKFELVINMKTAKALDVAVPQTLLVSADELFE